MSDELIREEDLKRLLWRHLRYRYTWKFDEQIAVNAFRDANEDRYCELYREADRKAKWHRRKVREERAVAAGLRRAEIRRQLYGKTDEL